MPRYRISEFYGIRITMKPDLVIESVEAEFGTASAVFSLKTGEMIDEKGEFPYNETAFVGAWVMENQEELLREFNRMKTGESPRRVAPLNL